MKYTLSTRRAVHRPPPITRPISLNHGLQVYLQTRLITASKCISQLVRSPPPSVSPNSLDYGLQVCTITASKCICKLARLCPPSASPNSLNHGLLVYLQTRSITDSKCISQLVRSRPPSTSWMSDSGCTQIQGWRRWGFTRSSSSGTPRIADNHRVLPVQIYRV